MMEREADLAWCKETALVRLERGDLMGPVSSMISNMRKHPELKLDDGDPLTVVALQAVEVNDREKVRRHIEGFQWS